MNHQSTVDLDFSYGDFSTLELSFLIIFYILFYFRFNIVIVQIINNVDNDVIFSFIILMNSEKYLAYLQQILTLNKIPYLSQQQFITRQQNLQKKSTADTNPLEMNIKAPLTGDIIKRYSRQMLLKQISYGGQLKLLEAKVAVIGSGGIGCPLALYLAGAGVGTIGLFDSDTVQMTNLHRQIGHKTSTIGQPKTSSLKQTLLSLNPTIKINEHPFITPQTSQNLDSYDLVIDGSDNPLCRYIVNDYCMSKQKKYLSGACIGWQAQITCYGGENACYRCIWGNDQVSLGGCSMLGVVGMLPGLVGIILAVEAVKVIVQGSSGLEGFLLTYSAKKAQFRKMKLRKKQEKCLGCSVDRIEFGKYDYSKYGNCNNLKNTISNEIPSIKWSQFIEIHSKSIILDVRPPSQYNIVHFKNSINVPHEKLSTLSKQELSKQIDFSDNIYVSCNRGVMSRKSVEYLQKIGIKSWSIDGGILEYRRLYNKDIPEL